MLKLLALLVMIPTGLAGDLTFMTLNTALFSQNPLGLATHNIRRSALLDLIANSPEFGRTDLACIQEVRRFEDYQIVSTALRQAGFVHQHSFINEYPEPAPTQPACNPATLLPLLQCIGSNPVCQSPLIQSNVPLRSICAFYGCPAQVQDLGQSCLECLIDHRRPPEQLANVSLLAQICAAVPASQYRPTLSVFLASRRPLTNLETVRFNGARVSFLQYGFLKADVEDLGSAYCTHQLSDQPGFISAGLTMPVEGLHADYNAANLNETRQIVNAMAANPLSSVLFGDLNTGPTTSTVQSENPASFQLYLNNGLQSALPLAGVNNCTFCGSTNALLAGLGAVDSAIDHVMLQSNYQNSVVAGQRLFLNNIPGQNVPVSDHYGVEVVINTAGQLQTQLSRWQRQYLRLETARERFRSGPCPAGP